MDYLQYKLYKVQQIKDIRVCFKPYYKWITFNTGCIIMQMYINSVLNLIINGLPSILYKPLISNKDNKDVLNLIINGLPSIR